MQDEVILKIFFTDISSQVDVWSHDLEKLCEEKFPGRYRIEVHNLRENPELAFEEQILASPTIVRKSPLPVRKVIGDLSDTVKVLEGLNLL
jgi:circadian clock protein KaiB